MERWEQRPLARLEDSASRNTEEDDSDDDVSGDDSSLVTHPEHMYNGDSSNVPYTLSGTIGSNGTRAAEAVPDLSQLRLSEQQGSIEGTESIIEADMVGVREGCPQILAPSDVRESTEQQALVIGGTEGREDVGSVSEEDEAQDFQTEGSEQRNEEVPVLNEVNEMEGDTGHITISEGASMVGRVEEAPKLQSIGTDPPRNLPLEGGPADPTHNLFLGEGCPAMESPDDSGYPNDSLLTPEGSFSDAHNMTDEGWSPLSEKD